MAQIQKWVPKENIPPILLVQQVIYGVGGLRIFLQESQSNQILQIQFRPYLGLRIFDESYRLKTMADHEVLNSLEDPWSLFISHDDDIIEWLKIETYDIIDNTRDIKCYMIVTIDEIIEVISKVPPTIKWLSEHDG